MTPIPAPLSFPWPDLAFPWSGLGPVASGSHALDFGSWGVFEWIAYSAMALVCIWVLWRAVVTTMHPREDAPDHVKRMILEDDPPLRPVDRPPTPPLPPVPPVVPT